jgi:hypothetical protein
MQGGEPSGKKAEALGALRLAFVMATTSNNVHLPY